jgi:dihydrofolate reductase
MARVLLDMAISVDGFVGGPSGADVGLYDWYFNPSEVSRPVIDELVATTGAIVIGRGTYRPGEESGGWEDTPYEVPHFVITHQPPSPLPDGKVRFIFVTDGVGAAINAAKEAAGDRYATIGGGADVAQQALSAGLVTNCSCTLSQCLSERECACSTDSIMDGGSAESECSTDPTSHICVTAWMGHVHQADLDGAGTRRSGDSASIVGTPSRPMVKSSSATMFSITCRTPSAPSRASP